MRGRPYAAFALACVFTVACGEDVVGSADELTSRLAMSSAGDRVCLSAGTFVGSFEVPAGVTLCGAGVGATRIVGPSDLKAIILAPGTAEVPTTVTGLTAESVGDFAIFSVGAGSVEITDVEVVVPNHGAGIGAESLTSIAIRRTTLTGPVTAANADGMPLNPTIADSALYGIVFVGVPTAVVEETVVAGFSYAGVVSVNTGLDWTGGAVRTTLGTNLLVHGGTASLGTTELVDALQGTRLIPAYNAVFAGNTDVTTNGISVSGSGGHGVLQSEATATHTDLEAMSNYISSLWVQNSGGFSLTGSSVVDSGMAGVIAYQTSNVTLEDVVVDSTRSMTRVFGAMPVMVGDGVQLVGSTTGVSLDGLTLTENSRVGLLVDLEGGVFDGITVGTVDVTGSGAQLGAVAQNGTVPAAWDATVTRSPTIAANDLAFTGTLDTVSIVGPSDMPAVSAIIASGLVGIVGPSD